MNDVLHARDNGDVSLLTLLDLSAAFDPIDHNISYKDLNTSMEFLVHLSTGSDPTFQTELKQ